jgi:general secretion pathway protein A
MYQTFFGLTDKPFSETPDPQFLFLSLGHREGLAHLEYSIMDGKGFSMLVGEVGTGKTTLCRALIDRLDPEKFTVVHIIHTNLDFYEFLQEVVEELGVSSHGTQKWDLLKALNHYLIEAYSQNRKVVLIVDEAQNLQPSVLEGIRMLSNLETSREKLIQIVFIGQPELMNHIQSPDMLQLKQRIAGSFFLGPLTRKETKEYILFRLNRVQTKPSLRFTPEALDLIYQYSKGVPRLINFVCDFSLMHAFVAETWTVDPLQVQAAYRELKGGRRQEAPLEAREKRYQGKLQEMKSREGQGAALKRLHVLTPPVLEVETEEDPSPEGENFLFPGEKSWRKTIGVAFGLALTATILISLIFREWNPESWNSKASSPPYQIQFPMPESEKVNPDDSRLTGKRFSKMTYEFKEFKFNPPGTPP